MLYYITRLPNQRTTYLNHYSNTYHGHMNALILITLPKPPLDPTAWCWMPQWWPLFGLKTLASQPAPISPNPKPPLDPTAWCWMPQWWPLFGLKTLASQPTLVSLSPKPPLDPTAWCWMPQWWALFGLKTLASQPAPVSLSPGVEPPRPQALGTQPFSICWSNTKCAFCWCRLATNWPLAWSYVRSQCMFLQGMACNWLRIYL